MFSCVHRQDAGATLPLPRPALPTLPRIRVLATGGTIAGAQTPSTRLGSALLTAGRAGGVSRGYQAAAFSLDALIAAVPQLNELARLDVEQVAAIGSQDMDEATWRQLAARTAAAHQTVEHKGLQHVGHRRRVRAGARRGKRRAKSATTPIFPRSWRHAAVGREPLVRRLHSERATRAREPEWPLRFTPCVVWLVITRSQ